MILESIRKRSAADPQHIILPEGEDPRTLAAAEMCSRDKIARITLIGNEERLRDAASDTGINLNGISIIDHRKGADLGKLATLFYDLRRSKGVTLEEAEMPTYLLITPDESQAISLIAKDWKGGLPFTILFDQTGGIAYSHQGVVKLETMKTALNKLIPAQETK